MTYECFFDCLWYLCLKDQDLAPIIEEEDSCHVPVLLQNLPNNTSINQPQTISEAETSLPQNEVRTLALYQPSLNPNFHEVTLTVDSNVLDKYKRKKKPAPDFVLFEIILFANFFFLNDAVHPDSECFQYDKSSFSTAIVPYVASEASNTPASAIAMEEVEEANTASDEQGEAMDVEECFYDQATMDVEEEQQQTFTEYTPMATEAQGVFQLEQQYKQQQFTNPVMYRSQISWYWRNDCSIYFMN